MTAEAVTWEELADAREQLITRLNQDLTEDERRFLLSIKQGTPEWSRLPLPGIEALPAVQWKLANVRKMTPTQHAASLAELRAKLKLSS